MFLSNQGAWQCGGALYEATGWEGISSIVAKVFRRPSYSQEGRQKRMVSVRTLEISTGIGILQGK